MVMDGTKGCNWVHELQQPYFIKSYWKSRSYQKYNTSCNNVAGCPVEGGVHWIREFQLQVDFLRGGIQNIDGFRGSHTHCFVVLYLVGGKKLRV